MGLLALVFTSSLQCVGVSQLLDKASTMALLDVAIRSTLRPMVLGEGFMVTGILIEAGRLRVKMGLKRGIKLRNGTLKKAVV